MTNNVIAQGAEAKIFLSDDNSSVLKSRVPKSYRHPLLDKRLRTRRTRSEAKILDKAFGVGVSVPRVLGVQPFDLSLEYVNGDKLSSSLNSFSFDRQLEVMELVGRQVSLLHQNSIIHGDLTTSNMVLSNKNVFLIDFGLSFVSHKVEDMAVDLHVLKEALEAKHFENYSELFSSFKKGYQWSGVDKVFERLRAVERRGRYKKNY